MTTPTAIEAALREAITRHLANIEHAIDYKPVPNWLREFERMAEFEQKFDAENSAALTLKETIA